LGGIIIDTFFEAVCQQPTEEV